MPMQLRINGAETPLELSPDTPLLWAIRDGAGLTGTRFGCGIAQCGACTVLVDGVPTRTCALPLEAAAGAEVVTIEGLTGPEADAVRAAWTAVSVPQCGYCQSGQMVSAVALLREVPAPEDADIDDAMVGNLCRCVTYTRIRAAIHAAAKLLAEGGE